ncbi:Serine O-acetyltransferase [Elusimicrobium minutum Pei191]|uniref:Serine O-acetyltransferase n=1 Tax=Elusimicrobium minutum (strain Pei191) TaxID=445932 RepID=B2KBH3_ELUMP|nr:serine O-acetyltransferase EpsC [Elusimicrobium minutum]ACC97995.1 Serine O-acetyltransferase [Elusimicrobium minutum Pei191]
MDNIKKISAVLSENIFSKDSPLHTVKGKECFFPSHKNIIDAFRNVKQALFVNIFSHKRLTPEQADANTQKLLSDAHALLTAEINNTFCLFSDAVCFASKNKKNAKEIVDNFIFHLPEIQKLLLTDIKAAFNGDPAALDPYQIVLCYPGLRAVCYQRMAHFFYKEGVQLIPRIITEYAHSKTGIDIHPGAKIGHSFFIDHGTGVVIGETCEIGNNVKIYQGVTLGAKSIPLDENGNSVKGVKRHPNLKDNVTVYANATILGNITVGRGAVIPGNSWVIKDIPPKK